MFRQLTLTLLIICSAGSFAISCAADRTGLDTCRLSDADPRPVMIYSQPDLDADIVATPVFNAQQSLDRIEISENEKWIKIKHTNHLGWVRANLFYCRPEPEVARSIIEPISRRLMQAIKDNDWNTIAQLAHPTKGIRFAPYGDIGDQDDQVVKADNLVAEFKSRNERTWGFSPGDESPITLTLTDYAKRFLTAFAYWSSKEITYNGSLGDEYLDEIIPDTYRHSITVAYRVNLDVAATGLKWSNLIMVFEEYEDKWFVVGFVHADSIM